MNETFQRTGCSGSILVNPALGTVRLAWQRGTFDPRRWLANVEAFGYQFGPPRKAPTKRSVDIPLRLGISAALAINVMLFSVSFYFGLSPSDTSLFQLFTTLSALFSTAVVFIGGWPFFTAAVRGLQSRVLHLDLPIALGIVLVYIMSLVQLATTGGRGDLAYFDTLNIFITLMLFGRLLQERLVERNRRYLLDDDGAEGLHTRRVADQRLETIPVARVRAGDLLLVSPGDLVPVEAENLSGAGLISTDWMTGESASREAHAGQTLPAGAFNAGRVALRVRARTDFQDSPLVALLRQPPSPCGARAPHQRLWASVARRWVVTVLFTASAGFLLWLPQGVTTAVNVAVALLVVTCPCAIGIAIPLAYELSQSRLRRTGFYVRGPDVLDRLVDVRSIVFDKTGTLTLGRLELVQPDALATQPTAVRHVLYNLAARSNHPASRCLARELERHGATYDDAAEVEEIPGQGLEWRRFDGTWRLGRPAWAASSRDPTTGAVAPVGGTVALGHDGLLVTSLATREAVRPGARAQLESLARTFDLWLLSGDSAAKVSTMGATLGFAPERVRSQLSPEDKASAVRAIGSGRTLFLGDGVNDALAFEAALVAGTPSVDRPVMPSKSHFFLVGESLQPVTTALSEARRLRSTVRVVIGLSLAYNLLAIIAGLAGRLSPVVAAVGMPASTLTLIALVAGKLARSRSAVSLSASPGGPTMAQGWAGFAGVPP
jgi:Cu2+-exporting ATPase